MSPASMIWSPTPRSARPAPHRRAPSPPVFVRGCAWTLPGGALASNSQCEGIVAVPSTNGGAGLRSLRGPGFWMAPAAIP